MGREGGDMTELNQVIKVDFSLHMDSDESSTMDSDESSTMDSDESSTVNGISIWNTFQGSDTTQGKETIFDFAKADVTDGLEFSLFPRNPPGKPEGGFYDIDVNPDEGTITWTLKDNQGATHLVLSDGDADRYFVMMEEEIETATVTETSNLNAKVSVPSYEEKNELLDVFSSGLEFPPVLDRTTIVLEVLPGANMTELEQTIVVSYTVASEDKWAKPTGDTSVEIWNTFQEREGTEGNEILYDYAETDSITDDVEFIAFPPNPPGTPEGGFYDIDISMDGPKGTITWTLKDNSGAGHLELGFGSFDRYYVAFKDNVESASLVEKANLNPKVTVPYYEEMPNLPDVFGKGLTFPSVLDRNFIVMEVREGGDMTELNQVIKVDFTLKESDKWSFSWFWN